MTDPTTMLQTIATPLQTMPTSGSFLTTTLWIAVGAAFAALIAGTISKQIKISEFRQEWINDLRKDIAEYLGAMEEYHSLQIDWMNLPSTATQQEKNDLYAKARGYRRNALIILWRVKMRFNPKPNRHKAEDDAFLASLDFLSQQPPDLATWHKSAEVALTTARLILKREWEVTKSFWRTWVPFL